MQAWNFAIAVGVPTVARYPQGVWSSQTDVHEDYSGVALNEFVILYTRARAQRDVFNISRNCSYIQALSLDEALHHCYHCYNYRKLLLEPTCQGSDQIKDGAKLRCNLIDVGFELPLMEGYEPQSHISLNLVQN